MTGQRLIIIGDAVVSNNVVGAINAGGHGVLDSRWLPANAGDGMMGWRADTR